LRLLKEEYLKSLTQIARYRCMIDLKEPHHKEFALEADDMLKFILYVLLLPVIVLYKLIKFYR